MSISISWQAQFVLAELAHPAARRREWGAKVVTLQHIEDPRIVTALKSLAVSDPTDYVRKAAAEALEALGVGPPVGYVTVAEAEQPIWVPLGFQSFALLLSLGATFVMALFVGVALMYDWNEFKLHPITMDIGYWVDAFRRISWILIIVFAPWASATCIGILVGGRELYKHRIRLSGHGGHALPVEPRGVFTLVSVLGPLALGAGLGVWYYLLRLMYASLAALALYDNSGEFARWAFIQPAQVAVGMGLFCFVVGWLTIRLLIWATRWKW